MKMIVIGVLVILVGAAAPLPSADGPDGWTSVGTATDSDTSRGTGTIEMPAPAQPWTPHN
jgi:hypothetical protein